MSTSAIMGIRRYLGIQLHLWASYEGKNAMNPLLYITAQLIKVVVIRPHPVGSADSLNIAHLVKSCYLMSQTSMSMGTFWGGKVHGGLCP